MAVARHEIVIDAPIETCFDALTWSKKGSKDFERSIFGMGPRRVISRSIRPISWVMEFSIGTIYSYRSLRLVEESDDRTTLIAVEEQEHITPTLFGVFNHVPPVGLLEWTLKVYCAGVKRRAERAACRARHLQIRGGPTHSASL